MSLSTIKTPGVYINELNAFPNTVVPVATAVPAFIGYTPQASYEGKSYLNKAQKITSFEEFKAIFSFADEPSPADPAKQYNPQYYLVRQPTSATGRHNIIINGINYAIVPDPNTIYYLYNSIRLFYQNGGGDAYIVSVGGYGPHSRKPATPGSHIINPNVKLNDLLNGLSLLKNEQEPTMYICPEATLLSVKDNATLMQEMLLQCTKTQTAISVFDVTGGKDPDPVKYTDDIAIFRNSTGANGLNYGVAYYPFVGTTVMQSNDIDYTNFFGGHFSQLVPILNPVSDPDPSVAAILQVIEHPVGTPLTVAQYSAQLMNISKSYCDIMKAVLEDANILPPSAAMAGVMTTVDNTEGVWTAPANTSIVGAVSLPIHLSEAQQGNLNIDAVSGKSINAIRFFNGQGILVWGARTLDGNSQDWKYLSVRRTMTYLEQSCKLAARAYIFEPNDKNTWTAVTAMISSFLTGVWSAGGLAGATPSDAFSVECGLGTTITSDDLLNGFMRVTVKVAVSRPAEFIVITFQQEQAKSA